MNNFSQVVMSVVENGTSVDSIVGAFKQVKMKNKEDEYIDTVIELHNEQELRELRHHLITWTLNSLKFFDTLTAPLRKEVVNHEELMVYATKLITANELIVKESHSHVYTEFKVVYKQWSSKVLYYRNAVDRNELDIAKMLLNSLAFDIISFNIITLISYIRCDQPDWVNFFSNRVLDACMIDAMNKLTEE